MALLSHSTCVALRAADRRVSTPQGMLKLLPRYSAYVQFSSSRPALVGIGAIILLALAAAALLIVVKLPRPSLDQAAASFNQNNFSAAITNINFVLLRDPRNVEALLLRAEILAQQGSITFNEQEYGQQAIAIAQQVLSIDPTNDEAYRVIGYANEIMQQYNAAHAEYQKALSLNPHNALAIADDAHAYDLQGELDKAKAGYEASLALDPNTTLAHMGLGRILVAEGDLDGALAQFQSVYRTSGNVRTRAEAAYSAGIISGMKGESAATERSMRLATTMDPTYPLAWAGLGAVLFARSYATSSPLTADGRVGLVRESMQDLVKAINLNPNQSSAYLQLGVELAALGQKTDAIRILGDGKAVVMKDITLGAAEKTAMSARIGALLTGVANRK